MEELRLELNFLKDKECGQHYKLYNAPMNLMLAFSKLQLFLAQNFGRHPVVTPAWVKKYMHHWQASSAKAERELGYQITPLKQGIQQTLEWLKAGEAYTTPIEMTISDNKNIDQ